ncbi:MULTISPECIES: hypothetical protein [unclassified Caballeronia]|uniref:hypothetical protein n=1 Tax=unclassified Caballeronia TaxID=2646786 RepID=UPI002029A4F8|nr:MULTISPECIES: hypothetical protein [unclassified Caballeronia]
MHPERAERDAAYEKQQPRQRPEQHRDERKGGADEEESQPSVRHERQRLLSQQHDGSGCSAEQEALLQGMLCDANDHRFDSGCFKVFRFMLDVVVIPVGIVLSDADRYVRTPWSDDRLVIRAADKKKRRLRCGSSAESSSKIRGPLTNLREMQL